MRLTSFILLLLVAVYGVHFVQALSWRFSEGIDEPIAMSRDIRAKEISPPSYMKRSEREQSEQLLRHIWLNNLQPGMFRNNELSQPLLYLPLRQEH
uniref:Uncharacterized protein n=1 Tax=Setaria digitata TaxID=48799 RepID=A0A915PWE7_9BILA